MVSPPVSMASMSASVSLLRIQSMSWRCERSPELSRRRRPGIRPPEPAVDLGSALRPSNSKTNNRSTKRIVSSTHRSSPCSALSIESGSSERSRSWEAMQKGFYYKSQLAYGLSSHTIWLKVHGQLTNHTYSAFQKYCNRKEFFFWFCYAMKTSGFEIQT